MDKQLERAVRDLAAGRCEYCRFPEALSAFKHVIDHIIARQHRGLTVLSNLSLCCGRCNLYKGPNIAGLDPECGNLTRLFNTRLDVWTEHFSWQGAMLAGSSAVGRTTVSVLAINNVRRVRDRMHLLALGKFF